MGRYDEEVFAEKGSNFESENTSHTNQESSDDLKVNQSTHISNQSTNDPRKQAAA